MQPIILIYDLNQFPNVSFFRVQATCPSRPLRPQAGTLAPLADRHRLPPLPTHTNRPPLPSPPRPLAMSAAATHDVPASGATNKNRVVLVSIDGWGISAEKKGNAIANANTDNMTKLEKEVRNEGREEVDEC